MLPNPTLCLVTDLNAFSFPDYLKFLDLSIDAGVNCVQLRDKTMSPVELKQKAKAIHARLQARNIPFIINDYIDLAMILNAEGVHLGQQDDSPKFARQRLGPDKIIGWSVESFEDLAQANELDCIDYVGAGSVLATASKSNCRIQWGLSGLQQVVNRSVHPVIAIGGIDEDNATAVCETGVTGIAVIGAIHQANDPIKTTQHLFQAAQRKP